MMNWDDLKVFLQVARSETLSAAATRLNVDPSTVSRRIHKLESQLETQLFDRSVEGHELTEHGRQLLQTAAAIEQQTTAAVEILQGKNLEEKGNVRLGMTEAFGNYFIAPAMAGFCEQHPQITVDLLPLQRFVKLSQHEADLAVTVEKPTNTTLVVSKLCDYQLRLYASREYLARHAPITSLAELQQHQVISYVDELIFSNQLCYLERYVPDIVPVFRSTSVVTQFMAVKQGLGLAVLPCFLAREADELVPVLTEDIRIIRSFWIAAHPERKRLARVNSVWQHLKQAAEAQSELLMGRG